jgi:hypothetical protein
MGLFDTLKWLWDPREPEQKAYDAWDKATPLQRHRQTLLIYIKGQSEPFVRILEYEDVSVGDLGNWRVDLDDKVRGWLGRRGTKGVQIDSVWYSPDQIERIEIGEKTVEPIE